MCSRRVVALYLEDSGDLTGEKDVRTAAHKQRQGESKGRFG
jgi:hypothetical protein